MSNLTLSSPSALKTYSIDPNHSTVRFWVRHMMISKVHGELSAITGAVKFDAERPELSSVAAEIEAASLATGQGQRDAHLKSQDFLDVEQYPTIRFVSKSASRSGSGELEILGDLTIHGTTREVTLKAEITPEVKSPFGGYKIGVTAVGSIDREDFGIVWNQVLESGGVLVGKEIHLQIDAELDRPE